METDQDTELKSPDPPPFIEVMCNALEKPRRFAGGTRAGFAVSLINRKLVENGSPLVSHIDAVKVGEEEVSFGPHAPLVHYGSGWKLVTVMEHDHGGEKKQMIGRSNDHSLGGDGVKEVRAQGLSLWYIGKIGIAFFLIFVFGAILTMALGNLPTFILFLNSFM